MISTITPYRSQRRQGSDGFGALVRSEWTKFRTVPAWTMTMILAMAGALGFCLFLSSNGVNCGGGPVKTSCHGQAPPSGPGGESVNDSYYLVHQNLGPTGSITAEITSLTNAPPGSPGTDIGFNAPRLSTIQPWAKAGIIITASTKQGSPYAAMMVTASHGVWMQYDYTHDVAGPAASVSAASPEWLRLTRSGATVTGYASADGTDWTKVGTTNLPRTAPNRAYGDVRRLARRRRGASGRSDHRSHRHVRPCQCREL